MNQGNNMNNGQTNVNVTPTPMPSTNTPVTPTPMPAAPSTVTPTPVSTAASVVTPTPVAPNTVTPSNTVPANQVNNVVLNQQVPNQSVNTSNVVAPTQNVINTGKKKSGNLFLFIVIILIGVFIYYIDDVLAYLNQSFTPVADESISDDVTANLVDGKYLRINDSESSYRTIKSIKFYNFRKNENNTLSVSYLSQRSYANSNSVNLYIELYNSNKEKIYSEKFTTVGSIEALTLKQYTMNVEEEVHNNVNYMVITDEVSEGNQ